MSHARTVDVGGETPYSIAIGPGLLADGNALAQHVRGRHVLLVSDSIVAPLYAGTVRESLHAARPDLASTLKRTSRSIPAMPIAESKAAMVVGMSVISSAARITTGMLPPA